MGTNNYHIKPEFHKATFPWPCESDKNRDMIVFKEDVFVRTGKDTYDMLTGIYKAGIKIPDENMIEFETMPRLVMVGLLVYIQNG